MFRHTIRENSFPAPRKAIQYIAYIALKLRANGRKNSQHCCANDVGSYCMRVGSGVQTDGDNSQQCWDLQCIAGRIQPRSLCKPCVMSMRGPNNVGRAVQTDPTLLRTLWRSRNKRNVGSCWLKSLTGFKLCATTCNRECKRTQHVTSNNVGSCWPTMLRPFARGLSLDRIAIRSIDKTFSCLWSSASRYVFTFNHILTSSCLLNI